MYRVFVYFIYKKLGYFGLNSWKLNKKVTKNLKQNFNYPIFSSYCQQLQIKHLFLFHLFPLQINIPIIFTDTVKIL